MAPIQGVCTVSNWTVAAALAHKALTSNVTCTHDVTWVTSQTQMKRQREPWLPILMLLVLQWNLPRARCLHHRRRTTAMKEAGGYLQRRRSPPSSRRAWSARADEANWHPNLQRRLASHPGQSVISGTCGPGSRPHDRCGRMQICSARPATAQEVQQVHVTA